MLERLDEGAVEGLSPRRRAALFWLETGKLWGTAVLVEPRTCAVGFSGHLTKDEVFRLVLLMGTTRLMPWFSVWVRVRVGFALSEVEGFVPAGWDLEVGRFLVDGLDDGSVFSSDE